MNAPAITELKLSSPAYLSESFLPVFETFRSEFPEGFVFTLTTGEPGKFVRVLTNDTGLAGRIISALEEAVR